MNDDAKKYGITIIALTEHYNNLIKNTPREELDLSQAQELIDQCKEIKD